MSCRPWIMSMAKPASRSSRTSASETLCDHTAASCPCSMVAAHQEGDGAPAAGVTTLADPSKVDHPVKVLVLIHPLEGR